MDRLLSRLVTRSAVAVCVALTVVAACTHTSDRVVEPVGGGDASTTSPEVSDASVTPIGPIAHPIEPAEDFRLVRAPEFGAPRESAQAVNASAAPILSLGDESSNLARLGSTGNQAKGLGGGGGSGNGGMGGGDTRPAAAGGSVPDR